MRIAEDSVSLGVEKKAGRKRLTLQAVAAGRGPLMTAEEKAGDGIRTHDVQLGKLAFYH